MCEARSRACREGRARSSGELGGSLGILLSGLGMRTGLWAALADHGPLTPAELSQRTGVAEPLAREWLRAQAAAGYLRYDPALGRFTLPQAVAVAMLHAPGGAMIDACTSMFCSMGGRIRRLHRRVPQWRRVRLEPAHRRVPARV
jgi:hypothetical protein